MTYIYVTYYFSTFIKMCKYLENEKSVCETRLFNKRLSTQHIYYITCFKAGRNKPYLANNFIVNCCSSDNIICCEIVYLTCLFNFKLHKLWQL